MDGDGSQKCMARSLKHKRLAENNKQERSRSQPDYSKSDKPKVNDAVDPRRVTQRDLIDAPIFLTAVESPGVCSSTVAPYHAAPLLTGLVNST